MVIANPISRCCSNGYFMHYKLSMYILFSSLLPSPIFPSLVCFFLSFASFFPSFFFFFPSFISFLLSSFPMLFSSLPPPPFLPLLSIFPPLPCPSFPSPSLPLSSPHNSTLIPQPHSETTGMTHYHLSDWYHLCLLLLQTMLPIPILQILPPTKIKKNLDFILPIQFGACHEPKFNLGTCI